MTTIPKPKYCGENWLEMNPVTGGRICGQCDKKILDFSKKSWAEIEMLQKQNNNSLCGMYDPKQIDNWGKEISTNKDFLKAAIITGVSISMSLSTYAQTSLQQGNIVIEGKVTDKATGEELEAVNVKLLHCELNTFTDLDGNFKFVVSDTSIAPLPDTIEIICPGYITTQIALKDIKDINSDGNKIRIEKGKLNLTLDSKSIDEIVYYIRKPTFKQRLKWKFHHWFGRKE